MELSARLRSRRSNRRFVERLADHNPSDFDEVSDSARNAYFNGSNYFGMYSTGMLRPGCSCSTKNNPSTSCRKAPMWRLSFLVIMRCVFEWQGCVREADLTKPVDLSLVLTGNGKPNPSAW